MSPLMRTPGSGWAPVVTLCLLSSVGLACRTQPAGGGGESPAGSSTSSSTSSSGGGGGSSAAADSISVVPVQMLPGHENVAVDTSPKQGQRMVPAEALLRSYLSIFGGLVPGSTDGGVKALALQGRLTGNSLFDAWSDYVTALGFPDYADDIPRGSQVNALMVATFERMGIALCNRAMEHDHPARAAAAVAGAVVFRFTLPTTTLAADGAGRPPAEFVSAVDMMHRQFLGYPLSLAPAERVGRLFQLYRQVAGNHTPPDGGATAFSAQQVGYAALCQAFIRHPEFHLY